MTIGQAVRAIRKSRGWTQGQLADYLGVPQQRVSEWERERNPVIPSPPNVARLVLLSQAHGHELLIALAGKGMEDAEQDKPAD